MVKLALVDPAGPVPDGGTVAALPLLPRATTAPPAGAAPLKVRVPVTAVPETALAVESVKAESAVVAGGGLVPGSPQTPGVPPPPQVCPKLQPHESVPPQPSGPLQAGMARSTQVRGEHPLPTVSGAPTRTCPDPRALAVMPTVVVEATCFAAWTVSAPPPVVQPPCTSGCP